MKNFKNLGFIMVLFAAAFFTSCGDDTPGGGTGGGGDDEFPMVSVSGPGVTVDRNVGDTVTYTITATEGDSPLNAITVRGDGVDLDSDRFVVDGVDPGNNPFLLFGDDKTSFTKDIGIIVSSANTDYSIIVTAEDNRTVTSNFTINAISLPPTLDFTSMMSGMVTLGPDMLQGYPLDGTVGGGQLSTLTIRENGEIVDPSRLTFNGPAVATNPISLSGGLENGFTMATLTVRSAMTAGEYNYTAILEDANGLTDELAFTINVENAVVADMGVLFNQAGPTGTGGLDLDDALGTGSMSTLAEIRDLGVDGGVWLKQIAPVNGSIIKKVVPGQGSISENFTFASVAFQSDIVNAYDGASDYNSETLSVGDMFAVLRDGNYYLINVAAINETTNNNDDNYEMDIKK